MCGGEATWKRRARLSTACQPGHVYLPSFAFHEIQCFVVSRFLLLNFQPNCVRHLHLVSHGLRCSFHAVRKLCARVQTSGPARKNVLQGEHCTYVKCCVNVKEIAFGRRCWSPKCLLRVLSHPRDTASAKGSVQPMEQNRQAQPDTGTCFWRIKRFEKPDSWC